MTNKKKRRQAAFPLWFLVVMFVAVASILFAVAFSQAYLVKSQQELDQLRSQVADAKIEQSKIQREVDAQSSPESIVNRAEEIGMIPGAEPGYLPTQPSDTTPVEQSRVNG